MPAKPLNSELISLIISHLLAPTVYNSTTHTYEPERVSIYSTVSKEWQSKIERHTFSSLHLTPSRLADFGQYVLGPRRAFVRSIDLDIILETYDDEGRATFESEDEQHRNNVIFTQTFQTLFGFMHSWASDEVLDQGITLSVKAHSPSDMIYCGTEKGKARLQRRRLGKKDLLDRKFERSYIRFVSLDEDEKASGSKALPVVPAITRLHCRPGHPRHIWPASCSEIAASLPGLREFDSYLCDNDKRVEVRRKNRNGKCFLYVSSYAMGSTITLILHSSG
jgi:hypothetical protein